LEYLKNLGVPIVNQAINAYDQIVESARFQEIERLKDKADHNEASALENVRRKVSKQKDAQLKKVIADNEAQLQKKDAEIARLKARLNSKA
ncbi:MAG: hypothetical protein LBS44_03610, partial [Deltaproteobacteria bacterium]|jgi:uncharacterized protein YbjQ (UPF0145 family)|nr:hypothetical protein [Deltaproteobacteria bacterium]